jgi:uncharacterized protein (TIGR00251 family)
MNNEFLRPVAGGVVLALKVQPRASRNEIGKLEGAELKVKVTAPPVDSAANESVLDLLSETLDCPRSALELLRGRSSRHKQILVRGLTPEVVHERLRLE